MPVFVTSLVARYIQNKTKSKNHALSILFEDFFKTVCGNTPYNKNFCINTKREFGSRYPGKDQVKFVEDSL